MGSHKPWGLCLPRSQMVAYSGLAWGQGENLGGPKSLLPEADTPTDLGGRLEFHVTKGRVGIRSWMGSPSKYTHQRTA